MKLTQKVKKKLWWLIISVDYSYNRIQIADHELTDSGLTLYLEDKEDFKKSLDECVMLTIPVKVFSACIVENKMNSYEGTKLSAKGHIYKTQIEIAKPIDWYNKDAFIVEQQWARESILKSILVNLVESETYSYDFDNH